MPCIPAPATTVTERLDRLLQGRAHRAAGSEDTAVRRPCRPPEVESLEETAPKTARDALETLFRAERELSLRPVVEGGRIAVKINKSIPGFQKAVQAIKAWREIR